WALTLTRDDTGATNLLFRSKVGIPNHRAAVATGRGIYYVDDVDENDPHFRILETAPGTTELIPRSISKQWKLGTTMAGIDLSNYRFDAAAAIEFGDLIVVACRKSSSTVNDTVFVYDQKLNTIDRLERFVSVF